MARITACVAASGRPRQHCSIFVVRPEGCRIVAIFNSLSVHQTNGAYQAIKPNSAFFALHEPLSEAAFFRSSDLVNSACKLVYLVI
jgi:hypothetical protein